MKCVHKGILFVLIMVSHIGVTSDRNNQKFEQNRCKKTTRCSCMFCCVSTCFVCYCCCADYQKNDLDYSYKVRCKKEIQTLGDTVTRGQK